MKLQVESAPNQEMKFKEFLTGLGLEADYINMNKGEYHARPAMPDEQVDLEFSSIDATDVVIVGRDNGGNLRKENFNESVARDDAGADAAQNLLDCLIGA